MTPQERDLINSVFERLGRLTGSPRDAEAEALIAERFRSFPAAPYHLVEAVVVQEQALTEANARLAELERQLAEARAGAQPRSGGLLSSLFGGGRPTAPQQYAPQPQYAPQQQNAPQQQYAPNPWGQPQPSAGGSFLRTAAGTAVGVAGGMMLANSISSMFGGSHQAMANPVSDTFGGATPSVPLDTQVADTGSYDTGSYDTGASDGGFDGGFDSSDF